MKVKSKTQATNSRPAFLEVIKSILVFDTLSIFIITITLAVPLTYLLTIWFLSPDKLRAPLASWAHRQGYFSAIKSKMFHHNFPETIIQHIQEHCRSAMSQICNYLDTCVCVTLEG